MIKLKGFFDVRVVIGIVLLAVVLGVLNNLRVYEEQRVNAESPIAVTGLPSSVPGTFTTPSGAGLMPHTNIPRE